jgi:peroxiredoxin
MQRVYEAYKDQGFVILAIDVQEEKLLVQEFADELGLTFPVLLDTKGKVTRSYRVRGLPTSYFIDQNGVILDVQVGPVDAAWMKKNLAQVGVE